MERDGFDAIKGGWSDKLPFMRILELNVDRFLAFDSLGEIYFFEKNNGGQLIMGDPKLDNEFLLIDIKNRIRNRRMDDYPGKDKLIFERRD